VSTTTSRLRSLDGLRAFCVLLVFAHHVDQDALPGGFLGVDVFFVISGFLITTVLLREHRDRGSIELSRFYLRRALRLCPALMVLCAVTFVAAEIDGIGRPGVDTLAALFYVTDLWVNAVGGASLVLHTWSLSVEEQFYVVWPALLLLLAGTRVKPLAVVAAVAMFGFALFAFGDIVDPPGLDLPNLLPTSRVAQIGAGVFLAYALADGRTKALARWSVTPIAAAAVVGLVVGLWALPSEWWATPISVILCVPPVAHLVLHRTSALTRAFSNRPMVALGERSYGFYLWHYPILTMLARHNASTPLKIGVGLVGVLIVTEVSWRFVEQPVNRVKNRIGVSAERQIVALPSS
jgi:peptidoglycan/LPS O-acetylase OafA/YrhL